MSWLKFMLIDHFYDAYQDERSSAELKSSVKE